MIDFLVILFSSFFFFSDRVLRASADMTLAVSEQALDSSRLLPECWDNRRVSACTASNCFLFNLKFEIYTSSS